MISAGSSELTQKWVDVLHNENEDYIIPESDVNIMCPYDCLDMSGEGYTVNGGSTYDYCTPSVLKNAPTNITRNKKIATFEWNYWVLDGSFDVLDTGEKFNGYMSTSMSREDCTFPSSPSAFINRTDGNTFPLNKNQTIKFNPIASECPAIFNMISSYGDGQGGSVIVNNISFNIEEMLENDDLQNQEYIYLYSDSIDTDNVNMQVIMTFTKTLMPYRRIRVSEYNNGYKFFKNKYDLLSFVHNRTTSLNSTELPQNNLEISFSDLEGIFDIDDTQSSFKINLNNVTYRFYVYYGYNFDDVGWSYVMLDTLCYDNLEIDRGNVETKLILKSTLLLSTQLYSQTLFNLVPQPQQAPYNWTTFEGFLKAVERLGQMGTITTPTDSTRPTGIDVSYSEWQERLYFTTQVDKDNGFHKIPCNQILQQIVALLKCSIVRNPDESMFIKNTYSTSVLDAIDHIEDNMILSYPTFTEETPYKKISFETPKIYSAQEDDKTYSYHQSSITYTLYPSRRTYDLSTFTNATEDASYTQNIVPLDYVGGTNCWTWDSDTQFFQDCVINYNSVHSARRYEFGEVILNPLLQVADVIYADIGNGIKIYRGLIEKIEVNYDGSFKGAITLVGSQYTE